MDCVICNHKMSSFGTDFQGIPVYRCVKCKLVKADNEGMVDYDNPDYFNNWGFNKECDYDHMDKSALDQADAFLRFIQQYTKGTRLLDVGTGNGLLPYLAKKAGYIVEGTDVSKHVCDVVPQKSGIFVHYGELENISFSHKYDVISLMHALEHTINPFTTLKKCYDILDDGGYVVVVVPNYRSLDCRLKDVLSRLKLKNKAFKHLACVHHNYVFALNNLELLGNQTGFKVVHRQTDHAAYKNSIVHILLKHLGLDGWCFVVYQK